MIVLRCWPTSSAPFQPNIAAQPASTARIFPVASTVTAATPATPGASSRGAVNGLTGAAAGAAIGASDPTAGAAAGGSPPAGLRLNNSKPCNAGFASAASTANLRDEFGLDMGERLFTGRRKTERLNHIQVAASEKLFHASHVTAKPSRTSSSAEPPVRLSPFQHQTPENRAPWRGSVFVRAVRALFRPFRSFPVCELPARPCYTKSV